MQLLSSHVIQKQVVVVVVVVGGGVVMDANCQPFHQVCLSSSAAQ
jgi:hypothetical protein